MVSVYNILRRTPLFSGLDRDRHTMLIRAADKEDILAPHPEIPDINVCRHIHPCEMSYVHRPVGIWQCTCNESSSIVVFHDI